MATGVGGVLKLLKDDRAGDRIAQLLGSLYCSWHAVLARCELHRCAVGLYEVATLHAHGLGHGEDELVALHRRHQSQAHTCVAARRLDDGCAGLKDAFRFGILDHGECHAVFHASAGVEIFHLCDDRRFKTLKCRKLPKFEKRSVAHKISELLCYLSHNMVVLLLLNFVECLLEVIQNVVDMLGADAQTNG